MSIYNRIPQLYSRKITFRKKLREVIFQRKHASKLHYIKHYFSFSSIYASSLYVWMVIIFHLVFFLFSW